MKNRHGALAVLMSMVSAHGLAGGEPAPGGRTVTIFGAEIAEGLRARAGAQAESAKDATNGWSKSKGDPTKILQAFDALRLKKGFVLRAYQFREGGNGNGFVWALPESAAFPEPGDCPRVDIHFLKPPKPPAALDDVMGAIEGDGSPRAHLQASLLKRELGEFGAMWHGLDWSTHRILGANPLKAPASGKGQSPFDSVGDPKDWKWSAPEPAEWNPQVVFDKGAVVVTFHTFSGHGTSAIHRHVDTFMPGSCGFKTERTSIATGGRGFLF